MCEELWLGRPLAWRNESSLANIVQRDPRASNPRISQMPAARKCVRWLRTASLCWHEWCSLWSCGLFSVTNSKRTRSTSSCSKSESCTTATDDYPATRADGFPRGFPTCPNHLCLRSSLCQLLSGQIPGSFYIGWTLSQSRLSPLWEFVLPRYSLPGTPSTGDLFQQTLTLLTTLAEASLWKTPMGVGRMGHNF